MYTAQDVVEYLLDSTGGGAQDSYHRVLRQAVAHSYRELITAKDWRWYETSEEIDMNAVASTDPYGYYETTLPWGTQSVDSITVNEPVGWDYISSYLEPRDFNRLYNNSTWNSSSPAVWTVDKDPEYQDRYRVRILAGWQYPCTATLTYRRRPKDLRYTGYEPIAREGYCNLMNSSAHLYASEDPSDPQQLSNFRSDMVGAILRIRNDKTYHPESLQGLHPYESEAVIVQANGPTADVKSPESIPPYTRCKYTITDALDISPGMYTAMLSGAEVWVARLMNKDFQGLFEFYQRDLRIAFEADAVAVISGGERKHGYGPYGVYGTAGTYGWGGLWWLYIRPGEDGGTRDCGTGNGGPNQGGPCTVPCDVNGGKADTEFEECGNSE